MKPQLSFHIPQPCHEDWNKMTPVDKGKFCNSCSKQVVDFSTMTDHEVLNYFSKTSGKVCGRFANDQLQRPMQPIKTEKKKTWWIAALMPLLLLFDKADAQKKNSKDTTVFAIAKDPQPIIMGKVLPPKNIPDTSGFVNDTTVSVCTRTLGTASIIVPDIIKEKKLLIHGKVTDQKNGEPIAFATIMIKGKNIGTATKADGTFDLLVHTSSNDIRIVISSVGFEEKELSILANDYNNIELETKDTLLPGVVVTTSLREVTAGGITFCKKVTRKQIIDTTIRKIFHVEAFKKYPNPVLRGNQLNVDVKQEGEFSIQLFDNNAKLLLVKDFTASKGYTLTMIDIPNTFVAGAYYVRLVNEKTKKQYTDKIIVQ